MKQLSRRETEICDYLRAGHSTKEIIEMMGIKDGTIRSHLHRIRKKLGEDWRTKGYPQTGSIAMAVLRRRIWKYEKLLAELKRYNHYLPPLVLSAIKQVEEEV